MTETKEGVMFILWDMQHALRPKYHYCGPIHTLTGDPGHSSP